MRIATIVGSLAVDSLNRKLANEVAHRLAANCEIVDLQIGNLPLYNRDLEADFPIAAMEFKTQLASCDGIIFVTPEYNRSIPAALKNAIEWGSRPWGKNSFSGKPAAIIGGAPGSIGTALAQQQLRGSY